MTLPTGRPFLLFLTLAVAAVRADLLDAIFDLGSSVAAPEAELVQVEVLQEGEATDVRDFAAESQTESAAEEVSTTQSVRESRVERAGRQGIRPSGPRTRRLLLAAGLDP